MKTITLIVSYFFLFNFLTEQDCYAQKRPCLPKEGPQQGCQGCGGDPINIPGSYGPTCTWDIPVVRSRDPNEIEGTPGYDSLRHWIALEDRLQYTVYFENDSKAASAPAQNVFLRIPLHPGINATTLKLGTFSFGKYLFTIPPNSSTFTQRIDVRDSLGVYVDVIAGLDVTNNEIFWTFKSIDPATGLQPVDPMMGFLPVNDSTADTAVGRGEGYVSFMLAPKSSLTTADTVTAQASIVFDVNDPILTSVWVNTMDAFPPASHMTGSTSSHDTIMLSWTGQDDPGGSGIRDYTIYVSQNSEPFQIYRTGLADNTCPYIGTVGTQYRFFSIATDNVGHREALKSAAEITAYVDTSGPVLPVTWLYFSGEQLGDDAKLSWATGPEVNCKHYVVERSLDSLLFSEIGVVTAQGNAQSNNYAYLDYNIVSLTAPRVYYRLRQVMLDNSFTYSDTVALTITRVIPPDPEDSTATTGGPVVTAYPNPFSGQITLQVINVKPTDQTNSVTLYSADGKLRYRKGLAVYGKATILLDDLPQLPSGIYVLNAVIDGKEYQIKMVKR